MPTYHYQCRDCGHSFDQFQKFSEDPLTVCPECGGTVQRVIQNVGVVFKGSGWYITDSRKSTDSSTSSSDSKGKSEDSGAKENGGAKADAVDKSSSEASTRKEPAAATTSKSKSSSD